MRSHTLLFFQLLKQILLVRDKTRWKNTHVRVIGKSNAGRPVFIVEEVVQGDTILNEALPLVEPFVTDDIPGCRAVTLKRLACFLSCNHQLALEFSTPANRFQLLRGDVSRIMSKVREEYDRLELEALDADNISAVLSLPTGRTEPVLIF